MTTVNLNREGTDVVELKLTTTGSNRCHFTSRENILNSDLDYIFAVTDLNVDCSDLPIFPPDVTNTFMTIKKRRVGLALAALPNADVSPTFGISPTTQRYFDVSSLIAGLSQFANTFSTLQDAAGINATTHGGGGQNVAPGAMQNDGTQYLKIGLDASGRLKFEGVSFFWNHFTILLSRYAVQLFQMQDVIQRITVGGVTTTAPYLSITTAGNPLVQQYNLLVAAGVLTAGNNLTRATIMARGSVLKFLDHRLYIVCETHLPVSKGLKVIDGSEKTDRSLIRVPFDNEATSTIYSENNRISDNIELTTKAYVGRVNFVNKAHPIRQWNTLTSSYEQRIFRFQLYVIYNVFSADAANDQDPGKFTQTKTDVPFTALGDWNLTLRFVNKL